MFRAPSYFVYKKYAFEFIRRSETTLRITKRKVHLCVYRMLSIYDRTEMEEHYAFLESLPVNDEFKVRFNVRYLIDENCALHEVRTESRLTDDHSETLVYLYFVEESSFSEVFSDSPFYNVDTPILGYQAASALLLKLPGRTKRIPFCASIQLTKSNQVLCPSYPMYKIQLHLSVFQDKNIESLFLEKICIGSYEKYLQEHMKSVVASDIRFSKLLFVNRIDESNYVFRLYMYPKVMNGADFLFCDPRTPVLNSISSLYETPTDGNLISFLLNSSYSPMKKISIPVKIQRMMNGFSEGESVLDFIETKVIYRELIFDKKIRSYDPYYFSQKKDDTQKIYFSHYKSFFYEDAKKRYDRQDQKYVVFRKNLFQKWRDIDVDFVVDGPSVLEKQNGVSCFQSMVDDSPILSNYAWLIVASYVYTKFDTLRFVAVAIPKDVAKQKFKDLTIGEGGITPFWIIS